MASRHPANGAPALLAGLVLWLLAGSITVVAAMIMIMNSAGCRSADEHPICDPHVQTLVFWIPVGAAITGFLLIAVGGGLALRHRRPTGPWQLGAWLLLLGALITASALTTA